MYKKGKEITENYNYPKIALSQIHVDIEKSGIVFDGNEECSTCQKAGRVIKRFKGLYFSRKEKVEYDIFSTKMLPGEVIFSNRFKDTSEDLLNLSFTKAEQYV